MRKKQFKILFIKQKGEDYLGDSIYHGLKSIYGKNVSCNTDLDYMYSNYLDKRNLYGKGFTLFCTLDPELKRVDDEELRIKRISSNYYDYIFYGSIWRCEEHLDLVMKHYPKEKIILFDGEDSTSLHPLINAGFNYFKREMVYKIDENLHPISFSIPKEKFIKNLEELNKTQDFGTIIPGRTETYIFENEDDYYKDYQKSFFGVTMKKAGWDCMRHYEILANGSLPYFVDIEDCPFYTIYNFPKELILKSNKLTQAFNSEEYNNLLIDVFNYSKENLTTEANIKYIFNVLNKINDKTIHMHPTIKSEYERLISPKDTEGIDIKEHLPTLLKYAQECDHITEMGVRSVVSTWAFLLGCPKKMVSYDVEYHSNIEKALVAAKEAGIQFDYILKDVLKTQIEETDFLFLDTWHVYEQVKKELEIHSSKVKKYIGFHDTTSYEWNGEGTGYKGIWPAIDEFLQNHPEWKIAERYFNNNGLTILKRI